MKRYGKIYVPSQCEGDTLCDIHFSFHNDEKGCFSRVMAYGNFAAANDIILVFPTSRNGWDLYGDDDVDYDT
jgi:hypothetical protein